MPEEGLETHEMKEALDEQREHAGGHGHGGGLPTWITLLSLSTALIAALAAVASLYSGSLANDAIILKNDAVLQQSLATDKWGEYQSKKLKEHLYATQAELMPPEKAAKATAESEREHADAVKLQAEARAMVAAVEGLNEKSAHALHLHHVFASAVTIFQVAIALAAIAALTRKKVMWWVSLVGGAMGVAFFVMALAPEHPHSGGVPVADPARPPHSSPSLTPKPE